MHRLLAIVTGWIRERRDAGLDWPAPGDQDVMGQVRTLRRLHDPADFTTGRMDPPLVRLGKVHSVL